MLLLLRHATMNCFRRNAEPDRLHKISKSQPVVEVCDSLYREFVVGTV